MKSRLISNYSKMMLGPTVPVYMFIVDYSGEKWFLISVFIL